MELLCIAFKSAQVFFQCIYTFLERGFPFPNPMDKLNLLLLLQSVQLFAEPFYMFHFNGITISVFDISASICLAHGAKWMLRNLTNVA